MIFGFGILRKGFGCLRKEKKKKNCLGMADGERKKKKGEKNEGRRWAIRTRVLETRVPRGSFNPP